MKKCPNCDKTFDDSMKFCQTDGTPLVDDEPAFDPYATIIAPASVRAAIPDEQPVEAEASEPAIEENVGSEPIAPPDDLLDLPDADPLKTMYVSESEMQAALGKAEPEFPEVPVIATIEDSPPVEIAEPPVEEPAIEERPEPEPPSFTVPDVPSPNFGDLAPPPSPFSTPPQAFEEPVPEPASFDETAATPPAFEPVPAPPEVDSAASTPSPFDLASMPPVVDELAPSPSPFDLPSTPPVVDEPASSPSPFDLPSSRPVMFDELSQATPVAENSAPAAFKQTVAEPNFPSPFETPSAPPSEWSPPPAPDANWQNQQIGANTPFQPPVAAGGPSSILAIVSLVAGCIGLLGVIPTLIPFLFFCGIAPFGLGIAALIMGFMARGRIKTDPENYSGSGLAMGGIITGALSLLASIAVPVAYALVAYIFS